MVLLASVARAKNTEGQKLEVPILGMEELGFDFQEIEADTFMMGSPDTEEGRGAYEKQVEVRITKNYLMAATETTQRQWVAIMGKNPSYFKGSVYCDNHDTLNNVPLCPEHPVEQVSWNDVQSYIKKLNTLYNPKKNCGATPKTSESGCFRLPTEAEWEHAARGGRETAYSFNNPNNLDDYAHYRDNAGRTQQVAQKRENRNRLYDMHGNVGEWVQDYWNIELPGGDDPLQTKKSVVRIIRGGSWGSYSWSLRSSERSFYEPPYMKVNTVGFRLVRML